ncbi:hypothetical protein BHM03_00009599 [Ensete ventricosum]|nr:hypothetical protein BHM03_00009599 [Ensete ventricosum]
MKLYAVVEKSVQFGFTRVRELVRVGREEVGKLGRGRLGMLGKAPRLDLFGSAPQAPPSRSLPRDPARRPHRGTTVPSSLRLVAFLMTRPYCVHRSLSLLVLESSICPRLLGRPIIYPITLSSHPPEKCSTEILKEELCGGLYYYQSVAPLPGSWSCGWRSELRSGLSLLIELESA